MQFLELIRREDLPQGFALEKANSNFEASIREAFWKQRGLLPFTVPQTIEAIFDTAQRLVLKKALNECKKKSKEYSVGGQR